MAVIERGELQQVGTPRQIYDEPANLFVAGFIGSPPMNLLRGRVEQRDGGLQVTLGSLGLPLTDELVARRGLEAWADRDLVVGIRPEDVERAGEDGDVAAGVARAEAVGASLLVYVEVDAESAVSAGLAAAADEPAEAVALVEHHGATVCAAFEPRSLVRAGDAVHLTLPVDRLHFFDPESQAAIAAGALVH